MDCILSKSNQPCILSRTGSRYLSWRSLWRGQHNICTSVSRLPTSHEHHHKGSHQLCHATRPKAWQEHRSYWEKNKGIILELFDMLWERDETGSATNSCNCQETTSSVVLAYKTHLGLWCCCCNPKQASEMPPDATGNHKWNHKWSRSPFQSHFKAHRGHSRWNAGVAFGVGLQPENEFQLHPLGINLETDKCGQAQIVVHDSLIVWPMTHSLRSADIHKFDHVLSVT